MQITFAYERSRHRRPLGFYLNSALLSKLTENHNALTDLGDLLKQLLIGLLRLCRGKTSALQLKPGKCSLYVCDFTAKGYQQWIQLNPKTIRWEHFSVTAGSNKETALGFKYLNSPQCVWELSLEWHLQVWWFPQLGREPMMNATWLNHLHRHVYSRLQGFNNTGKSTPQRQVFIESEVETHHQGFQHLT